MRVNPNPNPDPDPDPEQDSVRVNALKSSAAICALVPSQQRREMLKVRPRAEMGFGEMLKALWHRREMGFGLGEVLEVGRSRSRTRALASKLTQTLTLTLTLALTLTLTLTLALTLTLTLTL